MATADTATTLLSIAPSMSGLPTGGEVRTVPVNIVILPGSSRDVDGDLALANQIFGQCSPRVHFEQAQPPWRMDQATFDTLSGGSQLMNGDFVEAARLRGYAWHEIVGVYGKAFSGDALGAAFFARSSTFGPAYAVPDSGFNTTTAHELGHLMFNEPNLTGRYTSDHLMHSPPPRGTYISPAECLSAQYGPY